MSWVYHLVHDRLFPLLRIRTSLRIQVKRLPNWQQESACVDVCMCLRVSSVRTCVHMTVRVFGYVYMNYSECAVCLCACNCVCKCVTECV